MNFAKIWTTNGEYNYTFYQPGNIAEAMDGCPRVLHPYTVWWFPGRPTFGANGTPEETIKLLEKLPPSGRFTIQQEPIPNGAWWIRKCDNWAGPYSWPDVLKMPWEFYRAKRQ
jgi:hypothetical protein